MTSTKEAINMNIFDQKLQGAGKYPLKTDPNKVNTMEVNICYKCNLRCTHCYVESSPDRTEMMSLETINRILDILRETPKLAFVDITGGSPEMNPHYKYFVKSAADIGKHVIVRSNLAIFTDPGYEDIPEFLAENKIKIIASLPCYSEEGVDSQRGKGVYKKIISMLKKLNDLGYGKEGTGLEIDLVFNPHKAGLAPDQKILKNVYKEKLLEMHGIVFNDLIALPNHAIGRLGSVMTEDDKKTFYKELEDKFNPATVENAMCRYIVNVSYDGRIYDCECAQKFNVPLKSGLKSVYEFDYETLRDREIATTNTCLICTAGAGAT